MIVEFYIDDMTEGKALVIVFEKSKFDYEQRVIGLLKDIKVSEKEAEELSELLIDTRYTGVK